MSATRKQWAPGTGLDDAGQIVATCEPVLLDEPEDDQESRGRAAEQLVRLETIVRLIDAMIEGSRSPEQIGRRVAAIGFLVGSPSVKGRFRRSGQLARWLGVSPSALSHQLNKLRHWSA